MKSNALKLIDFEKVGTLLEGFNKTTGFVTAILDLEGNALLKSGWRKICTDFHRVHPDTAKKCKVSDIALAGEMAAGEKHHFYKCKNGLIDVVVPIIINEEHVANLFSGQFFFEKPDLNFFKKQAEKYKFDNKKYLEALNKVPIVSEEKVKTAMDFLLEMTLLISEMTQQKIDQIELNKTLKESEERWQFAIEGNKDGLFDWDIETNEVFYSKQWKAMLGYQDHEIGNNIDEWEKRVHPDDKVATSEALKNHIKGTSETYINVHRLLCKDGNYKWIEDRGKIISRTEKNKPLRLIGTHRDITDQKEAEYRIQESEEKYRALFENAPLSYQSLDEQGRFIDINPSWLRTLGYERDEVIGKFYADFLHLDYKPHFEKDFPTFKKRGYVNDVQFKIRHKKGHFIDISFEGCIGYLPDGSFKQTYCVFQDITERKKAEKELTQSEKRLSEAERIGKFGNWSNNLATGTIKWSDGLYQIFGLDPKQQTISYELMMSCIHEEDRVKQNSYFELMQALQPGQKLESLEYRIVLPNDEIRWLDIDFETQFDEENKPRHFFGTARDITVKKKAEDKLKMFSRVLNHSLNAFDIVNHKGEIIYVNQAYADMWGFETTDEIIGSSPESHCDDPNLPDHIILAIKKNGTFISEVKAKRKDGSIFDVLMYARLDYDEDGNEIYPTTSLDITESKLAEEKLKVSEEKFRTFVNTASDLMCITNKDGHLTDVNKAMVDILDYSIEELKKMHISNLLTEEALKNDFNPNWGKFIEDGKIKIETTLRTKRGNKITGELKAIAIYNRAGEVIGTRAVFIDLTERKQAEKALIESEERLTLALETNNTGAWELNLTDFTSKRTLLHDQIFGYDSLLPEWTFEIFLEHVIPEDRSFVENRFLEAINSISDWRFECRIQRPDGEERWISAIGRHIVSLDGKPLTLSGIVQDITDRKNAEKALVESEEKFSKAFNLSPNMLSITRSINGRFIDYNDAFLSTFGYAKDELEKKSTLELEMWVNVEDRHTVVSDLDKDLPVVNREFMFRIKSGETIPCLFSAKIIYVNDEAFIISSLNNITDQKKIDAELSKYRENLEELVKERTSQLEDKNKELERMNKLFVGRELRMVELKKKIKELEKNNS